VGRSPAQPNGSKAGNQRGREGQRQCSSLHVSALLPAPGYLSLCSPLAAALVKAGGVSEGRGRVVNRNFKKNEAISIPRFHWLSAGSALHIPAPLAAGVSLGFGRFCCRLGSYCASVRSGRARSELQPGAGSWEPARGAAAAAPGAISVLGTL
jgi:hypothetical protein